MKRENTMQMRVLDTPAKVRQAIAGGFTEARLGDTIVRRLRTYLVPAEQEQPQKTEGDQYQP